MGRTTRRSQAGSTLVEVLVSIVVLSFGLLGMVGLQAASLQNSRDARLQATAVRLAAELAERVRGNPAVSILPAGANPYLLPSTTSAPAAAFPDCFVGGCDTPLQVAQWDIAEWLGRVFDADSGLPGARVVVCFDAAPYDGAGLPRWDCPSGGGATGGVIQVKLGWTRSGTDRSKSGRAAFDRVDDRDSRPSVVLPMAVIAGVLP